jgi:hypothetical protein
MAGAQFDGVLSLVYLVFNTISNLQSQDEQVNAPATRTASDAWRPVRCRAVDSRAARARAGRDGGGGVDGRTWLPRR